MTEINNKQNEIGFMENGYEMPIDEYLEASKLIDELQDRLLSEGNIENRASQLLALDMINDLNTNLSLSEYLEQANRAPEMKNISVSESFFS